MYAGNDNCFYIKMQINFIQGRNSVTLVLR